VIGVVVGLLVGLVACTIRWPNSATEAATSLLGGPLFFGAVFTAWLAVRGSILDHRMERADQLRQRAEEIEQEDHRLWRGLLRILKDRQGRSDA
jgi:hypothetical protein